MKFRPWLYWELLFAICILLRTLILRRLPGNYRHWSSEVSTRQRRIWENRACNDLALSLLGTSSAFSTQFEVWPAIEGMQRPTHVTLDAIMHEISSKRIWMPKLVLYSIATLTLMIIIQPIKANIVGSRPIRVEKHALIFALPGQRENKSLEQL